MAQGKLKFTQTSKVRTTPIRRPETASDASGAKPQPSLTALRQAGPANVPAQGQASASAPGSAKAGSKSLTINPAKSGRTILKLSVKNLAAIPQPSTPRSTITLKTGASARPASAVSAAPTPIARAHPPVESKGPKIKLRLGSLGDKSSAGKPPLSSSHVNKNQ